MLAIGSDHRGYRIKEQIKEHLEQNGVAFKDFGTFSEDEPCSYVDIAVEACGRITAGECETALLFCGTGIGISIAANKIPGIRAACCSEHFSAKYARLHNNANALCLGARVVGTGLAIELVDIFLNTQFEGGRHEPRLEAVRTLESKRV